MIDKLKRAPGIYLVGFMASGKTTVGRLLADRLGWQFTDLDDDIEVRAGASIAEIFATCGEGEFRRLESDCLRARVREVTRGAAQVIALGGGAFAQPENLRTIEDTGVSVWLDVPFETARRRSGNSSARPLARDPQRFEELFHSRRAAYARADYAVPISSDDPAEAVAAILKLPLF